MLMIINKSFLHKLLLFQTALTIVMVVHGKALELRVGGLDSYAYIYTTGHKSQTLIFLIVGKCSFF